MGISQAQTEDPMDIWGVLGNYAGSMMKNMLCMASIGNPWLRDLLCESDRC